VDFADEEEPHLRTHKEKGCEHLAVGQEGNWVQDPAEYASDNRELLKYLYGGSCPGVGSLLPTSQRLLRLPTTTLHLTLSRSFPYLRPPSPAAPTPHLRLTPHQPLNQPRSPTSPQPPSPVGWRSQAAPNTARHFPRSPIMPGFSPPPNGLDSTRARLRGQVARSTLASRDGGEAPEPLALPCPAPATKHNSKKKRLPPTGKALAQPPRGQTTTATVRKKTGQDKTASIKDGFT